MSGVACQSWATGYLVPPGGWLDLRGYLDVLFNKLNRAPLNQLYVMVI